MGVGAVWEIFWDLIIPTVLAMALQNNLLLIISIIQLLHNSIAVEPFFTELFHGGVPLSISRSNQLIPRTT